MDVSRNRFTEGQRALQILHAPNHWQLLTRNGKEITFYCSLGLKISKELHRVIGHLMKLKEATKVTITYGACQRQVKLNCGVHVIAMALCFAQGADPSTAQFSHALMRDHLRHCFEVQALTDFPPPQAKEKIVNVSGEGIVEFKVPKLWHKLVAISPPKPKSKKLKKQTCQKC